MSDLCDKKFECQLNSGHLGPCSRQNAEPKPPDTPSAPREWQVLQVSDDPTQLVWLPGEFVPLTAYDALKRELDAANAMIAMQGSQSTVIEALDAVTKELELALQAARPFVNERLIAVTKERDEARAECDLRKKDAQYLANEAKRMQAERDRYRAALEHYQSAHYCNEGYLCTHDTTANEALK